MEGVTVANRDFGVNIEQLCLKLRMITNKYRLICHQATNYDTLECLTSDMVRNAYASNEHYTILVHDLLKLWFPSLAAGVVRAGLSWSRFWDLDLVVEGYLKTVGYPIIDDDPEDTPDLMDSDDDSDSYG